MSHVGACKDVGNLSRFIYERLVSEGARSKVVDTKSRLSNFDLRSLGKQTNDVVLDFGRDESVFETNCHSKLDVRKT